MSYKTEILAALAIFLSGALCGYGFRPLPAPPPVEGPAPEVRQKDGSLILERRPGLPAALPDLPEGSKVVRVAQVTLEPIQGRPGPVHVELVTVQDATGAARVVVASDSGKVLGGVDWAPGAPKAPELGPWAVGPAWSLDEQGRKRWGAAAAWSRGRVQVVGTAVPGQGLNVGVLLKF